MERNEKNFECKNSGVIFEIIYKKPQQIKEFFLKIGFVPESALPPCYTPVLYEIVTQSQTKLKFCTSLHVIFSQIFNGTLSKCYVRPTTLYRSLARNFRTSFGFYFIKKCQQNEILFPKQVFPPTFPSLVLPLNKLNLPII